MPLPLLHAAAGYAVYHVSKEEKKQDWQMALYCMALANAADLDFIPGILVGNPDLFHHSFTHSFTAGAVAGLAFAAALKVWKKRKFLRTALVSFFAYSSHVILDFLLDKSFIPVFWPLTPGKLTSRLEAFQMEKIHLGGFDNFVCDRFMSLACLKRFTVEMILGSIAGLIFLVYTELKKRSFRFPLPVFSQKD